MLEQRPSTKPQETLIIVDSEKTSGHKKTLAEKVNEYEKNLIAQELARTNGSVKQTYLTLGVPRKTFYDKMNKHGLKRKDFQPATGSPGKRLAFFK
jgi:two-component system C4-dicarboxylate transport response regulator DctD